MRPVARLLGWLMAAYLRLVAATSRVEGPVTQDQVVLAFWHEYNLAAATVAWMTRRPQHHHVSFSTQTFRGEVMTTMLRTLDSGSVPLPPETDRTGAARLSRELARVGWEGSTLVVSPDGPLGPYRRAKPGALIVSRESGLALQPWAVRATPSLRLRSRWDRHIVPLPFCRLRVWESPPIRVGPREPLRARLGELQAGLDAAASAADGGSAYAPGRLG